MNFGKVPRGAVGGGGGFSIQKIMLQILGTLNRAFWAWNWYKRVISGFRVCFFNNCFQKNQNKTHFEEGPQNGPHIWKSCACICHYLALAPPCIYSTISIIKKLQHNFSKMSGGGGRGSFGIFPKIHPIWRSYPSLMYITAPRFRGMKYQGQCCHQLLHVSGFHLFLFFVLIHLLFDGLLVIASLTSLSCASIDGDWWGTYTAEIQKNKFYWLTDRLTLAD